MHPIARLVIAVIVIFVIRTYSIHLLNTGREDERVRLKDYLDFYGPAVVIDEVRKGHERPDLKDYDFGYYRRFSSDNDWP